MKKIFLLVCLVIIYGSLYPFDFHAMPADALAEFMASWKKYTGRADMLSNVILFIPYGYFGVLAYRQKTVLIAGVLVLGLGLQSLQLYLPTRDANFTDVFWNLLGTAIGMGAAIVPFFRTSWFFGRIKQNHHFLILLIVAWLSYRLLPFAPSIDFQQIKDSLKPLLLHPQLSWTGLFHDIVAWLAVCCFFVKVARVQRPEVWLLAAVLIVFSLEIVVAQNTLSLTNVLGGFLALAIWWFWLRDSQITEIILLAMFFVLILMQGFLPLVFSPGQQTFHWMPFYGFLDGSILVNIASFFEKFFLYGTLLWLFRYISQSLYVSLFCMLLITVSIEFGQIFISDHTAEITDPLLVLVITIIMSAMEKTPADTYPQQGAVQTQTINESASESP